MKLLTATLAITLGLAFFVALPLMFTKFKNYSVYLFLLGTGAMIAICLLELLPEVFHMGGIISLIIIAISAFFYSVVHLFHKHHHEHDYQVNLQALYLFVGSLIIHNFASGMLLALSYELSAKIAHTVFIAIVAHKGYEAMMLASILTQQPLVKFKNFFLLSIYVISFPAGAMLSILFGRYFNHEVAMIISSVAVGALIGCLIFDFLVPSFRQLKNQPMHILWIILGFFLTQIIDF